MVARFCISRSKCRRGGKALSKGTHASTRSVLIPHGISGAAPSPRSDPLTFCHSFLSILITVPTTKKRKSVDPLPLFLPLSHDIFTLPQAAIHKAMADQRAKMAASGSGLPPGDEQ